MVVQRRRIHLERWSLQFWQPGGCISQARLANFTVCWLNLFMIIILVIRIVRDVCVIYMYVEQMLLLNYVTMLQFGYEL